MGTRSGDIDPALVFHLMREGKTLDEVEHMLQHKAVCWGFLGGLRTCVNWRRRLRMATRLPPRHSGSLCVSGAQAIGSSCAVLGRVDALVFTGGIGQHSAFMRRRILEGLQHMGMQIDSARNRNHAGDEGEVSHVDSRVKILVVPTNEELVIAREGARREIFGKG